MIIMKTTRKVLNIFKTTGDSTFGGQLYQVNYQRSYYRCPRVCTGYDQFCAIIEVITGTCNGKPAPVCRDIRLKKLVGDTYKDYSFCSQDDLRGPHADDIRKDMKCVTSAIARAFDRSTLKP